MPAYVPVRPSGPKGGTGAAMAATSVLRARGDSDTGTLGLADGADGAAAGAQAEVSKASMKSNSPTRVHRERPDRMGYLLAPSRACRRESGTSCTPQSADAVARPVALHSLDHFVGR